MIKKRYITAEQLMKDAYQLGAKVLRDEFNPDFIVGIWRGGTPVGIAVQELLELFSVHTDHISVRTASYTGMKQCREVVVHGLEYLTDTINAEDRLLIVDDVYDTGISIQALIAQLTQLCRRNTPDQIRIATAYYKPAKNETTRKPDYFVHEVDDWLVFPHELVGLTADEIWHHKAGAEIVVELMEKFDYPSAKAEKNEPLEEAPQQAAAKPARAAATRNEAEQNKQGQHINCRSTLPLFGRSAATEKNEQAAAKPARAAAAKPEKAASKQREQRINRELSL